MRLTNIMGADAHVEPLHARQTIADSIDLVVQLGIRAEVRRVVLIANLLKDLQAGEVAFDPIYFFDQTSPVHSPRWYRTGQLRQRTTAEMNLMEMIGSNVQLIENMLAY